MIEEVQVTQDIVNGPVFELRLGGELVIAQRFENCRKRSCFLPKIFCLLDWLSSANAIFLHICSSECGQCNQTSCARVEQWRN